MKKDYANLLREALVKGNIRSIGGIIYDANMKVIMSTSDLALVARQVGIRRVDSGGRPEWEKV